MRWVHKSKVHKEIKIPLFLYGLLAKQSQIFANFDKDIFISLSFSRLLVQFNRFHDDVCDGHAQFGGVYFKFFSELCRGIEID